MKRLAPIALATLLAGAPMSDAAAEPADIAHHQACSAAYIVLLDQQDDDAMIQYFEGRAIGSWEAYAADGGLLGDEVFLTQAMSEAETIEAAIAKADEADARAQLIGVYEKAGACDAAYGWPVTPVDPSL